MKLTELEAHFVTDEDERKIAVTFLCPKCAQHYHCIPFKNPIGGGEPAKDWAKTFWERTGDTLETLTLAPSILDPGPCGWHGFVQAGEIKSV